MDEIRSMKEYRERYLPDDCPECGHPKRHHYQDRCGCVTTHYTPDSFTVEECDCKAKVIPRGQR